jgi:hypothetical protein
VGQWNYKVREIGSWTVNGTIGEIGSRAVEELGTGTMELYSRRDRQQDSQWNNRSDRQQSSRRVRQWDNGTIGDRLQDSKDSWTKK